MICHLPPLRVAAVAFGFAGCGGGGGSGGATSGGNSGTTDTATQTNTYLPVSLGSTWTYNYYSGSTSSTKTQKITANANNQITQENNDTSSGKSVDIINISNGAYYLESITKYDATGIMTSKKIYTPAPGQWFFPASIAIGTKQSQTVQINSQPTNTNSTISFDMTVVGTAAITVPAGTFNNALKIETTLQGITYTSWFAQNVGLIRQDFNGTKSFELVSYSIK
jgi:hypothetical protein